MQSHQSTKINVNKYLSEISVSFFFLFFFFCSISDALQRFLLRHFYVFPLYMHIYVYTSVCVCVFILFSFLIIMLTATRHKALTVQVLSNSLLASCKKSWKGCLLPLMCGLSRSSCCRLNTNNSSNNKNYNKQQHNKKHVKRKTNN